MSYSSIVTELRKVEKEIGNIIIELVYKMADHYGVSRPSVTVRDARSVMYKHPRIYLIFTSSLNSILHEVKHHIDHIKRKRVCETYKEAFEQELIAPAFACGEFEVWIDEYSEKLLLPQLEYVEMKDIIRERRWRKL